MRQTCCTFVNHLSAFIFPTSHKNKMLSGSSIFFHFQFSVHFSFSVQCSQDHLQSSQNSALIFQIFLNIHVKESAVSYLHILILLPRRCWLHQLPQILIGIKAAQLFLGMNTEPCGITHAHLYASRKKILGFSIKVETMSKQVQLSKPPWEQLLEWQKRKKKNHMKGKSICKI